MINEHNGYILHLEHGEWVAYKSKKFKSIGKVTGARPEDGKTATDIERIVLGTSSYEEACGRLDARLKKQPKPKLNLEGQMRIE